MSDEWNGKNVLVLGLGDTGLSSVRWLSRHGARVRAADSRQAPPALGAVRQAHPDVGIALGPFDEALLAGMDAVVASPGVALREPVLQAAVARGIEVLGDVEIFAREAARMAPAPLVVGVTGTNGKSTVTALAAAMGTAAGRRSIAAGNIGLPVLDALEEGADFYAIELSSYQLETTASLRLASATMLNLSQDHLDRYDSMESYAAAKARIFAHCGTRVLNRDDPWSMSMAGGRSVTFGLGVMPQDDAWGLDPARTRLMHGRREILPVAAMAMKGLHNAANGLAAHALCVSAGLDEASLAGALAGFPGLPHRVQWVAESRGVAFYDDSKGTNVGASVAALEGFTQPVVLIAGGDGKQQDFAPLAPAVKAHARAVVLIGRDAPAIEQALLATGVPLLHETTMEAAVATAFALAREGDAVLLSPACASFDMFRNYGHRGQVFAAAAQALASGGAA
jgi:UDP-N-acetylmuramoylalanine--D-glutamate ligase